MSYSEVINESDEYRVKLIVDEHADEPYDCGQPPLLRIDRRYHTRAEHVMVGERPTDRDNRIEEAAARWASDLGMLEKYLRAFHGTTVIKRYGPNNATDYTYVVYDTPEWVVSMGYDDKCAPRAEYDAEKSVQMNEYQAYLEGEVYGYVVERKVHEKTTVLDVSGNVIREEESDDWDHVDSCWGFYGREYAEESALEAMESEMNGMNINSVPFTRGPEPAAMTDR